MLKMFSTQLMGLFKRIMDQEEFSFEDGARLLAQGPAGEGSIYICGIREMKAVEFEALEGAEPLLGGKILDAGRLDEMTDADRVLIFTRTSLDPEAVDLAVQLRERNIPFSAVSTVLEKEGAAGENLAELADVHMDLGLKKALLPDESGGRFGYPSSMAALFVYYGLKFTIDEIMTEFEDF